MAVRGAYVVLAVLGLSVGFMAIFFVVGEELRQDYRVLSRLDRERTDVALTDERVVWLEHARPGGAVMAYDLAAKRRFALEPRNASLGHPLLASGDFVAWVEGAGPFVVRVHDFAANATHTFGEPGDNLTLPGRTLEGRTLLVAGSVGGAPPALYRVDLPPEGLPVVPRLQPVKLDSRPRILDGSSVTWDAAEPSSPLRFAGGRAWWWSNATIHGVAPGGPSSLSRTFEAGGPVVNLSADGDIVAWAEVHNTWRRVLFADLANGTQGEVSAFPADQHSPAVNGSRLIFVQRDGLVRFKDLASGDERVLPARNAENVHLRLGATHAVWLSGTIEGHNVFYVPV